MDVVVVKHIRPRSERRREILAGAGVSLMQKSGFLAVRFLPVSREGDLPPVCERESGDVDCIAEGVLREPFTGNIVDRAAAVCAKDVEGGDFLAESRLRFRLNDLA